MSDFTRLLAVGRTKRADVMVPTDEPFAVAAPWLLDLLEERSGDGPGGALSIVRGDGTEVDVALSPADQDLLDGEIIRFVRSEDAPAPAEVSDVTTAVADAYESRPLPWGAGSRHAAAGIGVGILAAAIWTVGSPLLPVDAAWWVIGLIAVGFAALAAALHPLRAAVPAGLLTSVALGTWLSAAVLTALRLSGSAPAEATWRFALIFAGLWAVLGLGFGLGVRDRGAASGALVAVVPTLAVVVCAATGSSELFTWGVVGAVSAAVLGLVPWVVISLSGLAGLDDRAAASGEPTGSAARSVIGAAYGVSAWSTVALAVPLAASGVALAVSGDGWATGLAIALAVIAALRTRVAPGRVESLALWGSALIIALAVVGARLPEPGLQIAALAGLGVLAVVGAVLRPPLHIRARLRRLGGLLEWFAVVSLLPLLLGVLDLYSQLLGTFPA